MAIPNVSLSPELPESQAQLTLGEIFKTWWPLALSWLLMSVEGPAQSAVAARLANPEINLAAWGGIVFPISLIVEAPIIMLLPAATALVRDWDAYLYLRRFMLWAGVILTALHILVAFTPLYYIVARVIFGAPESIIEPARWGLMLMTPWSWSIAYRRFNQGVMIRFGHSRAVGTGTIVRLVALSSVLALGYWIHTIPGIIVSASAIATGVICEAIYAGLRVRPVLRNQVRVAPRSAESLTLRRFLDFYIPLALTSLLLLLVQPIGSAALSRMPEALPSLAVWPVITGLIFIMRSFGVAYNEVVVALLDAPNSKPGLLRFTQILAVCTTLLILVFTFTPLSHLWFSQISALPPQLSQLAERGLWFAFLLPAVNVLQSWYQGNLMHSKATRGITESVVLYMGVTFVVHFAGVLSGRFTGLYVGLLALSLSMLAQVIWLWYRARKVIKVSAG